MDQVEVITRRERRRRWGDEEKRQLVAAAFAPGAVVARVARQHDVAESCLYAWRKRHAGGERPRLIPVVVDEAAAPAPARDQPMSCSAAVVVLPDGTRAEIASGYPAGKLRALISALRRAP